LNQIIETVIVKPQEFTYTDELAGLVLFRIDFIATVKTQSGELKKILIEIQKAKNQIDLMRFRKYLGEQYKKEDLIDNVKTVLPITTIYILGFKLPEIDAPCLKIARNYQDLINKKIIDTKSDFVEKLTHDSFIVQVDRITDKNQTRLDKLLSVFEQKNFIEGSKIIKEFKHETDMEEVKLITDVLHYSGTDPNEKKKIETEQEAWRTFVAMSGDLREKSEKLIQELHEKDKKINKKDLLLTEMAKELEELKSQLRKK